MMNFIILHTKSECTTMLRANRIGDSSEDEVISVIKDYSNVVC